MVVLESYQKFLIYHTDYLFLSNLAISSIYGISFAFHDQIGHFTHSTIFNAHILRNPNQRSCHMWSAKMNISFFNIKTNFVQVKWFQVGESNQTLLITNVMYWIVTNSWCGLDSNIWLHCNDILLHSPHLIILRLSADLYCIAERFSLPRLLLLKFLISTADLYCVQKH